MEFENRKLNRINTAIETSVYDLLNFYRTPIKNPLTTAEKQQQNLWKQTSIITQQILQSPDTAQQWKEKFQAQLIKPDNTAPINKKTNKPKQYHRLDNYIRATIYRQLKNNIEHNLLQNKSDKFQ